MPVREISFFDFDDFRLDLTKQQLLKNGEAVALTNKAFHVLLILVQNAGQTVDKDSFYKQLWADSFVEDANLTQYIYVLRKALGCNASGESYIETVARAGYRIRADVEEIYSNESEPPSETAFLHADPTAESTNGATKSSAARQTYLKLANIEPAAPPGVVGSVEREANTPSSSGTPGSRKTIVVASAIVLVGLVALGLGYYLKRQPAEPQRTAPARSIAVLPFKTIGQESKNEKLGLGMADAIITRLSKIKQIPVRPTSAVARYTDNPPLSSVAAGNELGVDTVMEGTVQRENNRIRVSVQLVNVADGASLWADNFDENFSDIFTVQDSISAKVVRALEINLNTGESELLSQRATSNPEAYEAYQFGVYFGNIRSRDGLEKAVSYFQRAIDLDPNYARAYALLADSYNMLGYYKYADSMEMAGKARVAAEKALALNDSLAEAYIALAYLPPTQRSDKRTSRQLLERAIELSPYSSTARIRYGWMLLKEDVNSTVEQMRLAHEYDPLSPITNGALCNALIFQKNAGEAIKYCEKAVELSPEAASTRVLLADAYFLDGRPGDAIAQIKKRIAEADGVDKASADGSLAYYYASLGRSAEAEPLLTDVKLQAAKYPVLLNDLAVISYALGKREEGFAYLRQAYEKKVLLVGMLRYNPIWAEVNADERVSKLLGSSEK